MSLRKISKILPTLLVPSCVAGLFVTLLILALTSSMLLWTSTHERAILKGHTAALTVVAYSPDGKYLATGSLDRTARVWDAATGKELAALVGHTAPLEGVAFSPDGKTLATGSYDNLVKLWDWSTGKELTTFAGHTNMVRSLAWSPDG